MSAKRPPIETHETTLAAGLPLARDPQTVPTPLAIAAADFCRRAGRPSSPESIRLALARLESAEDAVLKSIVDLEPEATPLGPEALVDLVRGLSAEEAALREGSGYYLALSGLPRIPASEAEPSTPRGPGAEAPLARREAQRQALLGALAQARGELSATADLLGISSAELEARLKRLSLVRRAQELRKESSAGAIPPRVRKPGSRPSTARPIQASPPLLPHRGAARLPRGRLILGTAASRDLSELRGPEGKAALRALITDYKGNRRTLLERLDELYRTPRGPMTAEELELLLTRHGLIAEVEAAHTEDLRFLITSNRGDLGAAAGKLKITAKALQEELERLGLWQGTELVRDRFRRELFTRPLSEQAQSLLTRPRYLRDLGILAKLEDHVRGQVEKVWSELRGVPAGERRRIVAERLALADGTAADLIRRFHLR